MRQDELVELAFPTRYEVQLVSELGPDDERQRVFFPGANRRGGRDGLLVSVSTGGERWVGTFAFGGYDPGGLTHIYALPDPHRICVIAGGAGYIVRASDPKDWELIETFPILDARVVKPQNLLVLADFTRLTAYGRDGLAWTTERLSWDGVRIVAAEGLELWARVWDAPANEETTVAVDLRTGTHRGGAAPPPEAQ